MKSNTPTNQTKQTKSREDKNEIRVEDVKDEVGILVHKEVPQKTVGKNLLR